MNSRKGIRTFTSQTEGLKYYVLTVINAANRGWFRTGEVKGLFKRELEGWGTGSAESIRRDENSGPDHCVGEFWGLVCLPILSFFDGVVKGSDDSMFCDFTTAITRWKETQFVEGALTWHSQGTRGRFIHLVFRPEGGAFMYYDLGDGYDRDRREYVPRQKSSFLNLPAEGDEDFSAMSREGFCTLAKEN